MPIPASEFQNMAGRVGRMGYSHDFGKVIITASDGFSDRAFQQYLKPDHISRLEPRLDPTQFSQISLQLISAGICKTSEELREFLLSSFSASREIDINASAVSQWTAEVARAIESLKSWGYIL